MPHAPLFVILCHKEGSLYTNYEVIGNRIILYMHPVNPNDWREGNVRCMFQITFLVCMQQYLEMFQALIQVCVFFTR
jgi:hypothetical protein